MFYDLKQLPETDVSEIMQDLTFGFKHNSEPVDMIANEYFHLKIDYETMTSKD